jgi:hypothetical protein
MKRFKDSKRLSMPYENKNNEYNDDDDDAQNQIV